MRKLPLRLCAVAFGAWLCLFFAACGLDQVYLLSEPTVIYNNVYDDTTDYTRWYVEFLTNETGNSDYYPSRGNAFTFLGTEVYYKIYNNVSTLRSHRNSIESLNDSTNYSAAATRLVETYRYQTLGTNSGTVWSPFVECRERNTRVRIRLTSYGDEEDFRAGVWFDGQDMNVVPYRNGGRYSFDFFNKADDKNPSTPNIPPVETVSNDGDYWHTASGGSDAYYVQLYAVAVGRDSNYTPAYSLVLDLGVIPILKNQ